jgi:hypothetical protein
MHEKPSPQGHLRVCRCSLVVRAGIVRRLGWLGALVVAGVLSSSCVNLSYPAGASRDGGQAVPAHLVAGRSCKLNTDCASGNCNDGVCCKTDCSKPCYSCALDGNLGTCMTAPAGMNPHASCMDDGRSTCGHNGVCDGAGSCAKYAAGEICVEASCVAQQSVLASRCTPDGQCMPGQMRSCTPYLCAVGAKCSTQCASDDDCANGHKCDVDAGSCGKKALGTSCDMNNPSECDSGFCSNGVCCKTDCSMMSSCYSCAQAGTEGFCMPITAGAKPADPSKCQAMDMSTCGLDGTCDGAGNCRNFPAGTTCLPATCSSATLRPAGTCDGKAHCQVPAATTCGGFTCATASACKTSCATDVDCAAPSVCGGGACGGLTAQYFRATNLTDLAFTRTDPAINFNWGLGSPSPQLNVDSFSIRWRGKITARFTEPYTFYAATDDGERLIIGGVTRIDRFIRKPSIPVDTVTIMMSAGQPVDFVLEYFEAGGDASAVLSWSSAHEGPQVVIPTSAFSPQ